MSFETYTPEQQAHQDHLAGAAIGRIGLGLNDLDRRAAELEFAAPDKAAEIRSIVACAETDVALLPAAHLVMDQLYQEAIA